MKVYFLEVPADDLTEVDGKWVSEVVDFYRNNSYNNYSVVKSTYGFAPRKVTWIGARRSDTDTLLSWEEIEVLDEDFNTDSGIVENGRYIDTSGRIDIISYNASEYESVLSLTVYHSDSDDGTHYEDEWDYKGPVSISEEIALIDAERYGRLVFDFGDYGPSPMFLAYIRVEIDRPVMQPLYRSTRQLLDQFPEWMALSDVPPVQDTPELAEPTSLGGNFLNAIAGEWLDDIKRTLSYRDFQKHISTVDMNQMAWAYRVSKLPRFIVSITGVDDGVSVELTRTADQAEFRDAVNDDACYIDFNNDSLYTTKEYDEFLINDEVYVQELHQMWNYLDEIGLFVDLPRLRGEDNSEYQVRILDVYKNRGGVGVEQLKLALRRELSLWKYFGAAVDSDYEGATPEILDIEALEKMNDPNDPSRYFEPDGMPTTRFVELVDKMSYEFPTTWGRFHWGEAIWDLGGQEHAGYNVIPYRYDAEYYIYKIPPDDQGSPTSPLTYETLADADFFKIGTYTKLVRVVRRGVDIYHETTDVDPADVVLQPGDSLFFVGDDGVIIDFAETNNLQKVIITQSGVGDGNDLLVYRPDTIIGPREFGAQIKARGKEKVWRTEYPAVTFDLRVRGGGDRDVYDHPEKTVSFTLELTTDSGVYIHSFTMTAKHNADVQEFIDAAPNDPIASDATLATYEIFADDGQTSPEVEFRDSTTNELYNEDGRIPLEDITSVKLVQGEWQAGSYVFIETQDHFEAFFSLVPGTLLTYDSGPIDLPSELNEPIDDFGIEPTSIAEGAIVMRSRQLAAPQTIAWTSDEYPVQTMVVNGVAPYLAPNDVEFDIPPDYILWPDQAVTNRYIEFIIESVDTNDGGTFEEGQSSSTVPGAFTRDKDNNTVFLPADYILVDGSAGWVDGSKTLSETLADETVTISIDTIQALYPISFYVWELFETEYNTVLNGVVDENGPHRDGVPNPVGSTNFNFEVVENLRRDQFQNQIVPDSEEFIITWLGVESDNDRVIVWLDNNTVKPVHHEFGEYPETAIEEMYDEIEEIYYLSPVIVRARIKPEPDPQWNPQVHSGYFYEGNQEYYFYIDKKTEVAVSSEMVLEGIPRQGAPVIVTTGDGSGETLRQVAFVDESVEPAQLTLDNEEWLSGTGHDMLYASYADIYGITIEDEDGNAVQGDATASDNEVSTQVATEYGTKYLVRYRVNNSFFVDYDHIADGEQRARIVFDSAPATDYYITYENSLLDPAKPIDIPLNPLFSMRNEGFIFISHNEYTLDNIQVRLSPAQLLANDDDYMLITIDSLDSFGNPKAEQEFNLSTDFGTLEETTIVTDHDGFAVVTLYAVSMQSPPSTGTLTITGQGINATADFTVEQPAPVEPSLIAAPKHEKIQADGLSQNIVFGRVVGSDLQPVANQTVHWRQARSLYELFTETADAPDPVTTNDDGIFSVGPLTTSESEDSGYWFMKLEAEVEGFSIGDAVFWYEYPVVQLGVENTDGIPQQPVQMKIPVGTLPPYADTVKFPTSYDEQANPISEQLINILWEPPTWYAVPAWRQYQLGWDSHKVYKMM